MRNEQQTGMKKVAFALIAALSALSVQAQQSGDMQIQAVMDACIALRDAAAAGDAAALRLSAQSLREAGVAHFDSLQCSDDSIGSLKGHLVFNEAFADSLAAGNAAIYDRADDMNTSKAHRGQTTDGSYLTKTCFVPAGKSTTWTFGSMGHQEVAVVAEAGGLVTMKIHVTNSGGLDRRYDDTKAVRRGMPQRKTSFELPTSRRNTVEVEIVNCGQKDCSFVVISN